MLITLHRSNQIYRFLYVIKAKLIILSFWGTEYFISSCDIIFFYSQTFANNQIQNAHNLTIKLARIMQFSLKALFLNKL